jgi:hypothetical protein
VPDPVPDDRRDLVERQREHVVQHERDPLGGVQRLQNDEQGKADGVVQYRLVLGVHSGLRADDGIRHPHVERQVPAGTEQVQADPRDHRGQPGTEVVDVAGVGPAGPQPRLLHGVVGLGERTEHPVRHGPQM